MLELVNVVKKFNISGNKEDERTALDHVSLQIKPGEFITIIGGNGSGKSTTLNIISGALSPDKGKVLLNGYDTTKIPEYQKAAYFGRVFQDPMVGTAANMSVYENLEIAYARGRTHKPWKWGFSANHKKYFIEELKKFDLELEDRLNQKVGVMSGGQRQALTLLMATMRQRPSERIIKRDYVRFCEGDKEKAKEEVEQGFLLAKKERQDAYKNFEVEFSKFKNQLVASLKKFKESNIAFKNNSSRSKADKFEIKERNRIYRLYKKDCRGNAFLFKNNYFDKIKKEYQNRIYNYDLTKQILLLDEHTAALDPKTASKVLELTEKIVTENQMTTIMVTHNMKDAIRYGNRLIMMSHGKIVVDVSGEEKKKLTVEQLLNMFQVASKDDTISDAAILGD